MHNIELELMKDIIYNPEDDGYKMIYADWLEDKGEYKRAEEIRDNTIKMIPRIQIGYNKFCYGYIKNGFIYKIVLEQNELLEHAQYIFKDMAITEIELNDFHIPEYRGKFYINKRWVVFGVDERIFQYIKGNKYSVDAFEYENKIKVMNTLSYACVQFGRSERDNK